MKRKLDNSTKEDLIQTTLKLIDENGGASTINLREIARRAGCSAPNIYNYFSDFDDLMNAALIEICEDYKRNLDVKVSEIEDAEELLLLAFQYYIQYALDYPGRMNFYHFERWNITVSDQSNEAAISVSRTMAELLNRGANQELKINKTQEVCHHIHCYLLGELSEHITGRVVIEKKEAYVKELIDYCRRLYFVLMQN